MKLGSSWLFLYPIISMIKQKKSRNFVLRCRLHLINNLCDHLSIVMKINEIYWIYIHIFIEFNDHTSGIWYFRKYAREQSNWFEIYFRFMHNWFITYIFDITCQLVHRQWAIKCNKKIFTLYICKLDNR